MKNVTVTIQAVHIHIHQVGEVEQLKEKVEKVIEDAIIESLRDSSKTAAATPQPAE